MNETPGTGASEAGPVTEWVALADAIHQEAATADVEQYTADFGPILTAHRPRIEASVRQQRDAELLAIHGQCAAGYTAQESWLGCCIDNAIAGRSSDDDLAAEGRPHG